MVRQISYRQLGVAAFIIAVIFPSYVSALKGLDKTYVFEQLSDTLQSEVETRANNALENSWREYFMRSQEVGEYLKKYDPKSDNDEIRAWVFSCAALLCEDKSGDNAFVGDYFDAFGDSYPKFDSTAFAEVKKISGNANFSSLSYASMRSCNFSNKADSNGMGNRVANLNKGIAKAPASMRPKLILKCAALTTESLAYKVSSEKPKKTAPVKKSVWDYFW